MSQGKPPKKKVIVTTTPSKLNAIPAVKRSRRSTTTLAKQPQQPLVLGRQNYILMGVGALLIMIGLLLMSGGQMPSPDVWDDNIIYSFRRVTLAPLVIIAGLVVEVIAIFKN